MRPPPKQQPWAQYEQDGPQQHCIRHVRCSQCNYRRCRCPSKGYWSESRVWRVKTHHRCGFCQNGARQCFRDCRSRIKVKYGRQPHPAATAPPQYPQHPAATAHGSAPAAASEQLALPAPPAASLPPLRPFWPRAASRSPAASGAEVGGFGPSTQGELEDLVHTSGSAENPEDAPPPRKEPKAKMYVKSPYYHLWKKYVLQHKKDLRGGLSSYRRGLTRTPRTTSASLCISEV